MRHRKHRWLFLLAALAVFFGSAEALLRLFGLDRASEERFYDDIFDPLTRMIPGARNPYTDITDYMNSRGLRGPDFKMEKAPGVFRIVCLGDSTTFGMGDFGNSYPRVLDELLNEGAGAKRFEVINAGIPGSSLYQQRLHLETLFADAHPDMVLLMTGANYHRDLKLYRDKMKTPFFRGLNAVQRVLKRSALYRFLRLKIKGTPSRLRNALAYSAKEELPRKDISADYLEDLRLTVELCRSRGYKLVFVRAIDQGYIKHLRESGLRPGQNGYLERAATTHRDQEFNLTAEKYGIPVIDLSPDFVLADPETPALWHDPDHPGNFGNRIIARRIAAELRQAGMLGAP